MIGDGLKGMSLRNVVIAAAALFTLLFLFRSTPTTSSPSYGSKYPTAKGSRLAKVSILYGEKNEYYERALRSHQRHADRWSYPMFVLRHDIAVGFWNKPNYILSLVINELAKPTEERADWLMWVDADSIIINPAIPGEAFLPPSDLDHVHFVGTKDHNGLNTGIFFLRVSPWSVTMLAEVLGYPWHKPDEDLGRSADQEAMARIYKKEHGGPEGKGYRDGIVYMPRPWFNTYEFHHAYEGTKGDMLVHFPGLEEDRWPHMSKWLDIVEGSPKLWEVPYEETKYPNETHNFWKEYRTGWEARKEAETMLNRGSPSNGDLEKAVKVLKEALWEGTDTAGNVTEATKAVEAALRTGSS